MKCDFTPSYLQGQSDQSLFDVCMNIKFSDKTYSSMQNGPWKNMNSIINLTLLRGRMNFLGL